MMCDLCRGVSLVPATLAASSVCVLYTSEGILRKGTRGSREEKAQITPAKSLILQNPFLQLLKQNPSIWLNF